jgi:hypothetical protein
VLAGCGGSSGPTKAQYIEKADAACAAAHTQTAPLIESVLASTATALRSPSAAGARLLAADVQRLHAIALADLAKLKAVKQPSGEHAAVERFLKPLSSAIETVGQAGAALSSGQGAHGLALLEQLQSTLPQLASAASAYGLKQCESVLSP